MFFLCVCVCVWSTFRPVEFCEGSVCVFTFDQMWALLLSFCWLATRIYPLSADFPFVFFHYDCEELCKALIIATTIVETGRNVFERPLDVESSPVFRDVESWWFSIVLPLCHCIFFTRSVSLGYFEMKLQQHWCFPWCDLVRMDVCRRYSLKLTGLWQFLPLLRSQLWLTSVWWVLLALKCKRRVFFGSLSVGCCQGFLPKCPKVKLVTKPPS